MSAMQDFPGWVRRQGIPVNLTLISLLVLTFLGGFFTQANLSGLAFLPEAALSAPWTFVTYPFVAAGGLLSVLFSSLWLYGVGGIVEREEGSRRYLGVWLIFTVLCALSFFVGALATGRGMPLAGPWTPLAAITIIWGTRHPDMPVTFMFILPLKAKWLAWISALLVFFGTNDPVLAVFAAIPLILAWAYAARKLPIPSAGARPAERSRQGGFYSKEYYDEVKRREQEREERERLRKLFERSLIEDPEDRDKK